MFFLRDGVAVVFEGAATTKAALFITLGEALPKFPRFEHASKPK
jgi:hypothetical protein